MILDASGKPFPSSGTSSVVRRGSIDTYSSHPGAGLLSDMLYAYMLQAERGDPCRLFDCFEDLVFRDGHTRGLMFGRIKLTSGCEWTVQAGRQDKASELAAAELGDRLRALGTFRSFLKHHLKAQFFGVSLTNVVWGWTDGMVAPTHFENVAHRRYRMVDGKLKIANPDEVGRISLLDLEPGQWAASVSDDHRNPFAAGLLNTAAWWVMFKRWSIRDWQVFAEMFGLPLAIGFYQEGAGPTSRVALEEAVKTIGEDGFAILSDMCDLVIKETARSGDSSTVYPLIADRCDAELSKLITGGTANTDLGEKGSYAAGTIHADRAYALTRDDSKDFADMFVRDIGTWFVRYNGFDRAAPPMIKIQITRDNKERAEVVEKIGTAIDIDEDQLREEFGLRKPPAGRGVRFPSKATTEPGKGPPNGQK